MLPTQIKTPLQIVTVCVWVWCVRAPVLSYKGGHEGTGERTFFNITHINK